MQGKRVYIIGSGLAGAAVAYHLSQAGYNNIVILEANKENNFGASGNECGILFPRIELQQNTITDFYKDSFFTLLDFLQVKDYAVKTDFLQCGILVIPRPEKLPKYRLAYADNNQEKSYFQVIEAEQAEKLTGIKEEGLWLPKSGAISPQKLVRLWLELSNVKIEYNTEVTRCIKDGTGWRIESKDGTFYSEIVVIANSFNASKLINMNALVLEKIYGQVSIADKGILQHEIKAVICRDGYITPSIAGEHHLGATFEREPNDFGVTMARHQQNLDKLKMIPALVKNDIDLKSWRGRFSYRCYSKDRLPIIGKVMHHDNLYVSVAHGSRGILSGFMGGKIIADLLLKQDSTYVKLLSCARYT